MPIASAVLELVPRLYRETGLPIPAPRGVLSSWARGLGLPRRGRLLLYTGGLYQLAPYVKAMVSALARLEKRGGGRLLGAAARLGLGRLVRPPRGEEAYGAEVLRSIVALLRAAGHEPAFLGEEEMYSGVLLHDLGFDDLFAEHARRLAELLRRSGAETIVYPDPHTGHVLRELLPEYTGYEPNAVSYLELLAEALRDGKLALAGRDRGSLVIHDPCLYARGLGVVEQPRRLLEAAGYRVLEPRRSRGATACCGGPVAALSPGLALAVAEERLRELAGESPRVAVLCPICYASLSRAARGGVEVRDAALYLAEALPAAEG